MSTTDKFPMAELSTQLQLARMQREFAQLQKQENPRTIDFTTSLCNRHKNRYLDILANEETIYPPVPKGAENDRGHCCYINGNFVDLDLPHKFVACQAPVPQGMPDFLETLAHGKVNLVLMLTKLREGGVLKADRYWPEEGEEELSFPLPEGGVVTVRMDPEVPYEVDSTLDITRRKLIINMPGKPPHQLLQVQYTGWPDHGVPESAAAFDALLSVIKDSTTTSPILIHCSAGIGRTGTLIGAYAGITHIERDTLSDTTVYSIVAAMKRKRLGMVQRLEQYAVIYITVLSRLGVDISGLVSTLNIKAGPSAA
uniref:Putative tyrosine specific protein phosphatase n=1 Tax=Trypanosoma congolense (strain IL3000) TaxID=1068625 RepID=G0UWP3_TRYCI|nr:putative tyrosine specific protein phosphatase [Trypanosoma congolense IL3000]